MVTVHIFQPILMGKFFGAPKIQAFNISGDGFLKTKNQRRTQVKKNEDIFEYFSKNFMRLFYRYFSFY